MPRSVTILLVLSLAGGGVSAGLDEWGALNRVAHDSAMDAMRCEREGAGCVDRWKAALELTEQAYEALGAETDSKISILSRMAERAYHAGEFEKANDYAHRALEQAVTAEGPARWSIERGEHQANVVLGKLALRMDRTAEAKRYLLAAGRTPGSPTLNSFGPNMALARMLLERGERHVVLEYLALCRNFWKSGVELGKLDRWTLVVEHGGVPDFGANLIYGQ